MLRERDHPLPSSVELVYDDAERLVMELDLDDIDPVGAPNASGSLATTGSNSATRELAGLPWIQS